MTIYSAPRTIRSTCWEPSPKASSCVYGAYAPTSITTRTMQGNLWTISKNEGTTKMLSTRPRKKWQTCPGMTCWHTSTKPQQTGLLLWSRTTTNWATSQLSSGNITTEWLESTPKWKKYSLPHLLYPFDDPVTWEMHWRVRNTQKIIHTSNSQPPQRSLQEGGAP